jgi:putative transposase
VQIRRALRLRHFDYASAGAYFVTVCTHDRRCLFGEVSDDQVALNTWGLIVARQVLSLPRRFGRAAIDAFVVMPNHVHVVVWLDGRARQASPLRLGDVVGGLKSGSAREINRLYPHPIGRVWQRGYYDHVIRDEADLERVREYIASNPVDWGSDPENVT